MRFGSKALLGIAIVVLLIVAGGIGWWLHGSDDSSAAQDASDIQVGVPTIVSAQTLEDFADQHQPLYWAGEIPHTQIELTETANNRIYVRYIPEDAKAGTQRKYLTVGTYGALEGYEGLRAAKHKDADVEFGKNGAVIAVFKKRPLSTYFSFKNAAFQAEVFSPEKGESKKLTDDGTVTLVNSGDQG